MLLLSSCQDLYQNLSLWRKCSCNCQYCYFEGWTDGSEPAIASMKQASFPSTFGERSELGGTCFGGNESCLFSMWVRKASIYFWGSVLPMSVYLNWKAFFSLESLLVNQYLYQFWSGYHKKSKIPFVSIASQSYAQSKFTSTICLMFTVSFLFLPECKVKSERLVHLLGQIEHKAKAQLW